MAGSDRKLGVQKPSQTPPPLKPVVDNNRFAPRRADRVTAQIYFEGSDASTPCLIRDMSATGARVELRAGWDASIGAHSHLIDRALLMIRHDRVTYDCKIVRRSDTEIGLKFLATPRPIPAR